MTVAELVKVLQQRPQEAPVYLWDSKESFWPAAMVSYPAGDTPQHSRRPLPTGAVVIWAKNVM